MARITDDRLQTRFESGICLTDSGRAWFRLSCSPRFGFLPIFRLISVTIGQPETQKGYTATDILIGRYIR